MKLKKDKNSAVHDMSNYLHANESLLSIDTSDNEDIYDSLHN